MSEKDSAITFMVMVLPVPVAPAIRPWRFAIEGSRNRFLSDWASHIFLSVYIDFPPKKFKTWVFPIITYVFSGHNINIETLFTGFPAAVEEMLKVAL